MSRLARRVPLGRRNLFADRRRLAASAVAVGLAIMLILLLAGLWAGIRAQATLYEDHTGAALYVVSPGTQGLFTDGSSISRRDVALARLTPGVRWAAPVRTRFAILDLHGRKAAVGVVGAMPGDHGGVWALDRGKAPRADDEIVVDQILAQRHDLHVGSTITVTGNRLRVVGLSRDTSAFMTGLVFVTHRATDLALRSPGTTSAVLIGTSHPGTVRARLEAAGLTVLDRDQIRGAALRLATRIYGTPMTLMVGVGLIAGTLVIALIAYTAVSERRREYGIVKAIGGTGWRLARLAIVQTFGIAAAGALAGILLFGIGRAVIEWYRPQFLVVLDSSAVTRAGLALVVMATVAALLPARRLAHLDPAAAYRGA